MSNRKAKDRVHKLMCPECGSPSKCVRSEVVYGRSYGVWLYVCRRYPECDTYCGTHRGTKQPLGDMANRETRELRKQVHAAFDPLWKTGRMKRDDAYQTLADAMRISIHECHVGMFSAIRCKAALDCIQRIKEVAYA
jgi:hypothetical protein